MSSLIGGGQQKANAQIYSSVASNSKNALNSSSE
jgi:hypothetical protein